MPNRVGWFVAAGAIFTGAWAVQHATPLRASPSPGSPAIVVAELFTSEGCSSCPPAEDALREIARRPPAAVEILALAEHVDYWDGLGWRDPFSSSTYSKRQSEYDARVFHRDQVYTPQLVIDGRLERVGSDVAGVRRAIEQAARAPKAVVDVTTARGQGRELTVDVRVHVPPALTIREPVDLLVAVVEDDLRSEVRAGENGGRTLTHSAVVRSLAAVEMRPAGQRAWTAHAPVALSPGWNPANIRIVGFLQERESRRIVGAGAARPEPASMTQ